MSNEETVGDAVAKGDIVRIDFDGLIQETGELFDTTSAETAKANDVFDEKITYVPIPVLIGGGRVFPGLEEALVGTKVGEEKTVTITPDKAAGQRDPKLVEMFPLREFLKQKIEPQLGMEVNIKNKTGIITAVTAGRVRVDFNRRLAGRTLTYKFKVVSKAETDEEKAKAIVEMDYGTSEGFVFNFDGSTISIVLPDVCKYDQKWLMAKYKVVADLREAMNAETVRFIEEYVKKEAAPEEKAEEGSEEERAEEEIAPEEISPEEKQ